MLTVPFSRMVDQIQPDRTSEYADSDVALVEAAQADPRAFIQIYDRYVDPILRYCYARLGDRKSAEAATAEIFWQAASNLNRFPGGIFAPWLYTIARHVVGDWHLRQVTTAKQK